MPFITNLESVIEQVAPYSDTIWVYRLNMESEETANWQSLQSILNKHFPELTEQYRKIAFSGNDPYWIEVRTSLEEIQKKKCLNLRIRI